MTHFHQLTQQTLALLQSFKPQLKTLPENIAHIERDEKQGVLTLDNQFLQLPDKGELRTATIHSPKIAVITFLFFPNPATDTPIYAAEFVALAQKPIIAVIDAKCLLKSNPQQEKLSQILQQARTKIEYLSLEQEMPEWYLEARSGNDIFVKTPSLEQMQQLIELHLQLFEAFTGLLNHVSVYDETQALQHGEKLRHYKNQHRINSPGIPLLKRSFGENWTNQYLENYLFA